MKNVFEFGYHRNVMTEEHMCPQGACRRERAGVEQPVRGRSHYDCGRTGPLLSSRSTLNPIGHLCC